MPSLTQCLAHYAESNDHRAMLSVSSDHLDSIVCCRVSTLFFHQVLVPDRVLPRD
jgi:hypothetical protein